jgi:hypothetical protein
MNMLTERSPLLYGNSPIFKDTSLKKIIKYTLRIVAALVLLLLVLYSCLSIYVSSNKASLIKKMEMEVKNLTGGDASIGDLSVSVFNNFPFLSIKLNKVEVKDSMFTTHGHRFFYAEKLFLRLNPLKLIVAKIAINKLEVDNAGFYLYTDSLGYTNAYLLQSKSKPTATTEKTPSTQQLLYRIAINNTSITINDRVKNKLFDIQVHELDVKTTIKDSLYHFQVKESILVRSLAFNTSIGSYLTNHSLEGSYALYYSPSKKELGFDDIAINISKQPFHIAGQFSFGEVQTFALQVSTKNILVDFAKTLLTQKTGKGISLVGVKGPVDVAASLNGSLKGGNPLIVAKWSTQKNTITTPLISFDNCSFNGSYTNEVVAGQARNDENSSVAIHGFKGDWQGLTMASDSMLISNLTVPVLAADLHASIKVTQLNALLQTDAMSLTAGDGSIDMYYKGPFDHISPINASLNGRIKIRNGNILMQSSQANLSNCNASIRFVNADVVIDSLTCTIHNDPIFIKGEARNALALLGDAAGNIELLLNMNAPVLHIDQLSSILYRKLPARKKSTATRSGNLAKTAQKIDNLLSSGNIHVNMDAGKIVYRRFEARNAKVEISINENAWSLDKASLMHGTGSMLVTGKVTEQADGRFALNSAMKMKDVDAQKVWYEFEDFGMPALTHKNIKGILSVNANVSMGLDRAGNFNMKTLKGDADFSIKKGELINFKPLQDVHVFLFKNRDFANVSFAEIKDGISFANDVVTISPMEINSTALTLFVEGFYGLSGKTDISIQLPLSNLKKKKKDYKPENTGKSGGMSVFLRAQTADDGTIKIKYDPLKRFRKTATSKKKPS